MSLAIKNCKMFLFLSACWIMLSDTYTPHMFLNMALSNVFIIALGNRMEILPNIRITFSGINYCIIMIKNIILSSIFVLNLFKKEKPVYKSAIKIVGFKDIKTDLKSTLHAAAITITPGTTVLAIDKKAGKMLVHAIEESLFMGVVDDGITKVVSKSG